MNAANRFANQTLRCCVLSIEHTTLVFFSSNFHLIESCFLRVFYCSIRIMVICFIQKKTIFICIENQTMPDIINVKTCQHFDFNGPIKCKQVRQRKTNPITFRNHPIRFALIKLYGIAISIICI